jgi:hypothetical protein
VATLDNGLLLDACAFPTRGGLQLAFALARKLLIFDETVNGFLVPKMYHPKHAKKLLCSSSKAALKGVPKFSTAQIPNNVGQINK